MLKIKAFSLLVLTLLATSFVSSTSMEQLEEAQKIINSKTPCEELTDKQLEAVGEYYMEQMHPGELHESMDAMMGGEGSESLKQVHINMAQAFYCGNSNAMSPMMMNFVVGRNSTYGGMMGYGNYEGMMQGRNYSSSSSYWNATSILFNVLLIVLIILAVVWILKISKTSQRKK